jgi:hypothetical protein
LLLVFFVHSDRFQIFGFNDYTAVEAFKVVDAVTPGNDHSAVMLANGRYGLSGLHKADYGFILTMSLNLSSLKIKDFYIKISAGRRQPPPEPDHKPCPPA